MTRREKGRSERAVPRLAFSSLLAPVLHTSYHGSFTAGVSLRLSQQFLSIFRCWLDAERTPYCTSTAGQIAALRSWRYVLATMSCAMRCSSVANMPALPSVRAHLSRSRTRNRSAAGEGLSQLFRPHITETAAGVHACTPQASRWRSVLQRHW